MSDPGQPGQTVLAGVVGWPIAHSRSPVIHRHWLKKYAISGDYLKKAVSVEDAPEFFSNFAATGWTGCNVTVPHKETAFELADLREPAAMAVGAANTLWLENGRLCATNTDTYGFITSLEAQDPSWRDASGPVLILGAGGAARAICYGFVEAGCERIIICNRSPDRANALAEAMGPAVEAQAWETRGELARNASVIVNTTTLGMSKSAGSAPAASDGEDTLALDLSQRDSAATVCDIVYVPLETGLLAHARETGNRPVDGLGMLLHQAVPGFERWFGVRPQVTADLRQAVLDDLASPGTDA